LYAKHGSDKPGGVGIAPRRHRVAPVDTTVLYAKE